MWMRLKVGNSDTGLDRSGPVPGFRPGTEPFARQHGRLCQKRLPHVQGLVAYWLIANSVISRFEGKASGIRTEQGDGHGVNSRSRPRIRGLADAPGGAGTALASGPFGPHPGALPAGYSRFPASVRTVLTGARPS